MAVTYGFFNSVNGDRKYNADQMSEYFRGIVSQGVFQHLDSGLAVSAGTGLSVSVAAGRAIIQDRWIQNSAALNLTILAASETYGRKDAVVIRLDKSSRAISITVKTGTPAASPVAPSMTRNATTYEMALAYVNVAAGASSVTVTDKRSDSSVCGWAAVAQATSGEVDQMLNDMKTGFDGVTYSSPAEMVQGEDAKIASFVIPEAQTVTNFTSGIIETGGKNIGDYIYFMSTPNGSFIHVILPCEIGDKFIITGRGGAAGRLFAVVDNDNKLVYVTNEYYQVSNYEYTADSDGFIIFHFNVNYAYSLSEIKNNKLPDVSTSVNEMKENQSFHANIYDSDRGYVTSNTVGAYVDISKPTLQNDWQHSVIPVVPKDEFLITAYPGSNGRIALTDSDYKILWCSEGLTYYQNYYVKANEAGYLIVNGNNQHDYNIQKKYEYDDVVNTIKGLWGTGKSKPYPPYFPTYYDIINTIPYDRTEKMSLAEIYAAYDELVSNYPAYITKDLLGKDESGSYDMYKYTFSPLIPKTNTPFTNNDVFTINDYPTIFLEACLHGNEYPCGMALLNFMKMIAESTDGIFAWLKNFVRIIVIPIANPYGYENDTRQNSNYVDLNRNFPKYWENGSDDSTGHEYRGSAPLSEKESQYISAILNNNNIVLFYDFHTHGVFTSYQAMTDYDYSPLSLELQRVGYDVVNMITDNGHKAHDVPANSGFIGILDCCELKGFVANYAASLGIPGASPEVLWRIYGTSDPYLLHKNNCMNVEYICGCVASALKMMLF